MRSIIVKLIPLLLLIVMAARAQEQDAMPSSDQAGYRVNAGDRLDISVWKEPDLQRQVLVRPDGAFSFPLAGQIMAQGRTVTEIREELESRLAKYIPDLVSTVTVVDVNGNRIFVIGQVNTPGSFVMNPVLDVMQALSMAGGMTPFASLKNIRVLRRENGVQWALEF
ncbi:MAG TPA: polysaccharide biosynthesis/export family protein, partial [Woeseiaceae bacterium]|nr:polysaccharide biosynthesis/export family protein [Woeseiaceae bacterium]